MEAPTDITTFGLTPASTPSADAPELGLADVPAPPSVAPAPAPENPGTDLADTDPADIDADSRLIRPYAITGGRTVSSSEISLEAQIQTSTRLNGDVAFRWEAATILKLAERPMALVEIAARAEIPIGVARVVISDLVEAGAVNIQRNAPVTSYTSLLEKVLDGIRDL